MRTESSSRMQDTEMRSFCSATLPGNFHSLLLNRFVQYLLSRWPAFFDIFQFPFSAAFNRTNRILNGTRGGSQSAAQAGNARLYMEKKRGKRME